MVNNRKGTIMGTASCEWVRQWLPLLVEDADETRGDGDDLSCADRHQIVLHIDACKPCREYRASLEAALSLLAAGAAEPPVESVFSASIWPNLEMRIQRHHERSESKWVQWLWSICPMGFRVALERLSRGCGRLRGEVPLQIAWLRDSLDEALEARLTRLTPYLDMGSESALRGPLLRLGYSSAVALILALVIMPIVHRRQVQAEAQIAANAASIPSLDESAWDEVDELVDADGATGTSSPVHVSDMLAQTDRVQTAEASTSGQSASLSSKPSMTTASPRLDFDLEQGIPMPPDARGSKPAY
jgi:hypothetical protein